jgi:hypothetical protein
MKQRMINMLIVLLAMCLTTASKQSSNETTKCSISCCQEVKATTIAQEKENDDAILSPINLFMIHAQ